MERTRAGLLAIARKLIVRNGRAGSGIPERKLENPRITLVNKGNSKVQRTVAKDVLGREYWARSIPMGWSFSPP